MKDTNEETDAVTRQRLLSQLLWRLMELEVRRRAGRAMALEEETELGSLQGSLPRSLLQRFDMRLKRGQVPLATPQDGKCSACYITLPRSHANEVERDGEVAICPYCGVIVVAAPTALVEGASE